MIFAASWSSSVRPARTCCCRTSTGWPGRARVIGAGAVAASLGLLGFAAFWSPPGPFLATVFLYVFGLFAIVGGPAHGHQPQPGV